MNDKIWECIQLNFHSFQMVYIFWINDEVGYLAPIPRNNIFYNDTMKQDYACSMTTIRIGSCVINKLNFSDKYAGAIVVVLMTASKFASLSLNRK